MRYIFSTFLMLGVGAAFCQTGNYFLSHFAPSEDNFSNVCFDMAKHPNGLMYFATRTGVLQFDGRTWTSIPGTGPAYSIDINSEGLIFWAGARGFGNIESDEFGQQQGRIRSAPGIRDVYQSLISSDGVFFLSADSILVCDFELRVHTHIRSSPLTGNFTDLFEIGGEVYVDSQLGGLFKISQNRLEGASLLSDGDDVVVSSKNGQRYLIVDDQSHAYISSKAGMMPLTLEDQQYVTASSVIAACWIGRNIIALGTLRGGLILVDATNGQTREIINYATGLPDNEVFSLWGDNNESLWVAHERGFTRVAPNLPLRSFSHYKGLNGNLLSALSFDQSVYVGTSIGLFRLVREETYEEITYYVNVDAKKLDSNGSPNAPKDKDSQAQSTENESKRKGFLHFLRRNRSKRTTTGAIVDDETVKAMVEESADPLPTTRRVKRTERILRSAQYSYEPVAGIGAKISHLVPLSGKLIAAGLGGVYEVRGQSATAIMSEPSRSIFVSSDGSMLFVSTYDGEIRTFVYQGDHWEPLSLLANLKDQITTIFQERDGIFWFCGLENVYRLEITNRQLANIQAVAFSNTNFDSPAGFMLNNKPTLITSGGFFQYDSQRQSFQPLDLSGSPVNYYGGEKMIWYRDSHQWNELKGDGQRISLPLLNLFRDIRSISTEPGNEGLWIITGNNELYKFSGREFTPSAEYAPLLQTVRHADKNVSRKGILRFDEERGSVTFELTQPDFLAPQSLEYRFQLAGLDGSWSDWSRSYNVVDFPYLPPGDYTLNVESRDIFGKIGAVEPIRFEVLAPYWKRTWFYALEFAVFSLLVLLSLRLSSKYLVVSRLLSLLTIILLIQFIQTVIGEVFETRTTPVLDFFVQVLIALVILPFEGYLRRLLMGSGHATPILHELKGDVLTRKGENLTEP